VVDATSLLDREPDDGDGEGSRWRCRRPAHASRQLPNAKWTSKLGAIERTMRRPRVGDSIRSGIPHVHGRSHGCEARSRCLGARQKPAGSGLEDRDEVNGPDKALILSLFFDGEPSFITLHRQLVDACLQFRGRSHAHDFPSDARSKTAAQGVEQAIEHFVVGCGSEPRFGSHEIRIPAARSRYNAMRYRSLLSPRLIEQDMHRGSGSRRRC
jgi:hypothetical protein